MRIKSSQKLVEEAQKNIETLQPSEVKDLSELENLVRILQNNVKENQNA